MANAKRLPSGNWHVQVFDRIENGKRKYKSFTAPTRKEVEYQAARYAAKKQEDKFIGLTVEQAVSTYIDSKKNVLSPSTLQGYCVIAGNYFSNISKMKIDDLTQGIIQAEINRLAADHSPKTCRNANGLLMAVLKVYKPEMIVKTTMPAKKKKPIYVPDEAEVEKISKLVKGTPLYIPFLLATQCGLRASEICGLELSNVHKDHIDITQARVIGNEGETLKQPKSASGYRSIPIDGDLYEILVSNADGERVYANRSCYISNCWCKFRLKHNLNAALNFHALRHHFCSKCLLLGVPQKYIAELMGHSDTKMIEQVYQHTFPSAMSGYAQQIRKRSADFLNATRNATREDENRIIEQFEK